MRSALFAVVFLAACGPAELAMPTVPEAIQAPLTEKPVKKVFAKGTQNYKCLESTTAPGTFAFTLVGPDATLYDGEDDKAPVVGHHTAGPTWTSTDGSTFVGDSANTKKAAAPDATTAIPWLLLPKKDATGTGEFSKFSFAQRINTSGGVAPATGCDSDHVNAEADIAYTANYYFYETR